MIADLTAGTGHFKVTQGALATVQGGAVAAGCHTPFMTLSGIAVAGLVLYLAAVPETRAPAQS